MAPSDPQSWTVLVQSILHPERITLGTTGSPAGFLMTSPTPKGGRRSTGNGR